MASYALLNAFAGFQFDMVSQSIGFNPIQGQDGQFRCFWSLDSGWGEFEMTPTGCEVRVLYGDLTLRSFQLPFLADEQIAAVTVAESPIAYNKTGDTIEFGVGIQIGAGATLSILSA